MIGKREMVDSTIDLGVGVPRAFSAELPDPPLCAMLAIEEVDELLQRGSVGDFGVVC